MANANPEAFLFPSYAVQSSRDEAWITQFRGWVFERDLDSKRRKKIRDWFADYLDLEEFAADSDEVKTFQERTKYFITNDLEDLEVTLSVPVLKFVTATMTSDSGFIKVVSRLAMESPSMNPIPYEMEPTDTGSTIQPTVLGKIFPIPEEGISIISDIDDTIKESSVLDKKELLKNTFLRPFKSVSGMAELYRQWQASHAIAIHYVSSSPWQLLPALLAFFQEAGFPEGTMHLKRVSLTDAALLNLFKSPRGEKVRTITKIVTDFPKRKFVLIGDSSEKDPEVYGEIARLFSKQIQKILIRNVTNESLTNLRMKTAMQQVPIDKVALFKTPDEISLTLSAGD